MDTFYISVQGSTEYHFFLNLGMSLCSIPSSHSQWSKKNANQSPHCWDVRFFEDFS